MPTIAARKHGVYPEHVWQTAGRVAHVRGGGGGGEGEGGGGGGGGGGGEGGTHVLSQRSSAMSALQMSLPPKICGGVARARRHQQQQRRRWPSGRSQGLDVRPGQGVALEAEPAAATDEMTIPSGQLVQPLTSGMHSARAPRKVKHSLGQRPGPVGLSSVFLQPAARAQ